MAEQNRLLDRILSDLGALAPMGYRIGAQIRFAVPLLTRSTMPDAWERTYQENSFALRDPMVFWGIAKSGTTRWSAITLPDPFGVLRKAGEHGLKYGATVSCGKITSRTLIGVARGDREFTDAEIAAVEVIGHRVHEIAAAPDGMTQTMIESLRLMGEGVKSAEAAERLGMDERKFADCVTAAREMIGASTNEEAVEMARKQEMI